MSPTWLTNAACLVVGEVGDPVLTRRTIEVRDGCILALHAPGAAPAAAPGEGRIYASRMLAMAGLVNAHTHSPDNLIRGSAPNLPLELWSLHSAAGRERRTPREVYLSALLGCIEMLRTGTTTVLDHIRVSPDLEADSLDAVARAYRDAGMRAVIAPVVADRAVADTLPLDAADLGGTDIAAYGRRATLPAAEQVAIVAAFLRAWQGVEGRIYGAIGPSGPQRCSDRLLLAAAELSDREAVPFHTHALETRAQREMGFRLYGKGMIAHLGDLGILSPRTSLAHAIWLEPGDAERLAAAGAAVVHNPVSNARLGSGTCALPALLRAGVRVALGTDSACCNDGNNLFDTMKWATLLPNLASPDPEHWITPGRTLRLATEGGAAVLGLGGITGRLAPGLAADITLLRLASPSLVPLLDPVRQLVQAEGGAAVDTVLVGGRVVLQDGRCTLLEEAAIWAEAQSLAERRLRDNAAVYAAAAALEAPVRRMHARLALRGCCA